MDDLESPFYLVLGRDPLEGRLSNLQNYCRYLGDQPGQIVVQELRKLWKLHAKLLMENRVTKPINDWKVTITSDLKVGQFVFVKDHCKGTFDPSYTFDHKIAAIIIKTWYYSQLQMARRRGATPIYQANASGKVISRCLLAVSR